MLLTSPMTCLRLGDPALTALIPSGFIMCVQVFVLGVQRRDTAPPAITLAMSFTYLADVLDEMLVSVCCMCDLALTAVGPPG